MSIKERAIAIIKWSGLSTADLERETGIDRYKWANLKSGKIRTTEEHMEALGKLWPEYAYWLMTGNTIPEAGQISPEITRATSDSLKAEEKAG